MLKDEARGVLKGLEVGALDAAETEEGLSVVVRGMRDNPLHVAVFGEDPEIRARRVRRLLGGAFAVMGLQRHMLAARSADGTIVGVVGMLPPSEDRPTTAQQLRLLPRLLSTGPRAAVRAASWMGTWAKSDPEEPHWHVGPVAVDAHLQGKGVGSRLMRVFCAKMDAARENAYLETDKPENVRFYERFGFEVVGEQDVLGVPNWFMLRRPAKRVGRTTAQGASRKTRAKKPSTTGTKRKEQAMILKQNTLTFGVLTAAFTVSALYQAYRAMLNEVPEYDAFTPDDGVVYLAFFGISALVMTDRRWAWWVVSVLVVLLVLVSVFWYYPVVVPARIEAGAMGLVGWLESSVYLGLLFVAGFVCAMHLLGVRLVPDNS